MSASYYFSDIPYTALWGTRLISVSKPIASFHADAAAGNLPAISYVDAVLLGEPIGLSDDDHPISNVANEQAFMNGVYNAVRLSRNWPNTLLIINYDEWGGFADHVPPPMFPPARGELNILDPAQGIDHPLIFVSGGENEGKLLYP